MYLAFTCHGLLLSGLIGVYKRIDSQGKRKGTVVSGVETRSKMSDFRVPDSKSIE